MSFALVPSVILGYLLGSFPAAFLLVRWKSRIDIRDAGSGNAGALNSYQVSGSRTIGAAVLALDATKGILAVLACRALWPDQIWAAAAGGLGAVTGHNFSPWIGFRGGRGLATGAGVMALIAWPFIPLWGAAWLPGYLATRDVNIGNAGACSAGLLAALFFPAPALGALLPAATPVGGFRVFGALMFLLLLSRLLAPLRAYLKNRYPRR